MCASKVPPAPTAGKSATTRPRARAKPSDAPPAEAEQPASELIDAKIEALADWRGAMLSHVRSIVRDADRDIVEEWKWRTPVWSLDGLICTGEAYKSVVKMTFAKGASLPDPTGLFNASLDGGTRRAIDLREGDAPDPEALKALVRAAVAFNRSPPHR